MSTRHLLNTALGAVGLLLLAAVAVVFATTGRQGTENSRIDLATRQQMLIQNLVQQVADLGEAENLAEVNQARGRMAASIIQFDQTLSALLQGGAIDTEDGRRIEVRAVTGSAARLALEDCADLWRQTGVPLADLAAGEFSVFSAAGQQALRELDQNHVALMNLMATAAEALQNGTSERQDLVRLARGGTLACAGLLLGLGLLRWRLGRPEPAPRRTESVPGAAPEQPRAAVIAHTHAALPTAGLRAGGPVGYTSPVDFDHVNAAVDQMSVDMNTIAGSTDKMRLAIDSVGHALQGMLYSLNEMAQDTAEGHKIVRGVNNAAAFTADAAGELGDSAREMSRVVARVTQLAARTKQIAAQIDAEAVSTGQTGEAFTSVVAAEVKGLARQTSGATAQIEQTVAEILGTARQYEEAIGQIIKNVSNINKVSQHLGELMLTPPQRVVPGTPAAPAPQAVPLDPAAAIPAPTLAPAPEPAPAPAPVADAPAAPEPVAEADPWGGINDDPVTPEPTAEDVAEQTSEAIAEAGEPEAADSSDNVFMLGGASKEPAAAATPAEPEAEPAAPAPVPAAAAPEPEPEAEDGGSTNIFMLNKPKKKVAPAPEPAAEPAAAETEPEAAVPVGGPAEEEEKPAGGGNIFMLNKPKK